MFNHVDGPDVYKASWIDSTKQMAISWIASIRSRLSSVQDERGVVMPMAALMIIVLLGFAALAVDVGQWYAAQSRMQSAADLAAIAAAVELSRAAHTDASVTLAAERRAAENGFDPADGATIAVNIAADDESVEVIITRPQPAVFAQPFLDGPVNVAARAVGGVGGGSPICLLVLDPNGSKSLYVDSNARLEAPDCAVHVNSSSGDALGVYSNSGMNAASICVVGGDEILTTGPVAPTPETACPPKSDPLASLAPPSIGSCDHASTVVVDDETETLSAGVYCGGIEIKNNSTVTFNPGIYVIKNNKLLIDSNSTATGVGVSIYLADSSAIAEFNSNTAVDLSAPTSGAMAGVLVYQNRSVTGVPVSRIDSNSVGAGLAGTFYFPAGKLLIDSNGAVGSGSPCLHIIAHQVEFNSNTMIHMSSDADACSVPIKTAHTGGRAGLIE